MSAREYVYVRKSWRCSEDDTIVVVNRYVMRTYLIIYQVIIVELSIT